MNQSRTVKESINLSNLSIKTFDCEDDVSQHFLNSGILQSLDSNKNFENFHVKPTLNDSFESDHDNNEDIKLEEEDLEALCSSEEDSIREYKTDLPTINEVDEETCSTITNSVSNVLCSPKTNTTPLSNKHFPQNPSTSNFHETLPINDSVDVFYTPQNAPSEFSNGSFKNYSKFSPFGSFGEMQIFNNDEQNYKFDSFEFTSDPGFIWNGETNKFSSSNHLRQRSKKGNRSEDDDGHSFTSSNEGSFAKFPSSVPYTPVQNTENKKIWSSTPFVRGSLAASKISKDSSISPRPSAFTSLDMKQLSEEIVSLKKTIKKDDVALQLLSQSYITVAKNRNNVLKEMNSQDFDSFITPKVEKKQVKDRHTQYFSQEDDKENHATSIKIEEKKKDPRVHLNIKENDQTPAKILKKSIHSLIPPKVQRQMIPSALKKNSDDSLLTKDSSKSHQIVFVEVKESELRYTPGFPSTAEIALTNRSGCAISLYASAVCQQEDAERCDFTISPNNFFKIEGYSTNHISLTLNSSLHLSKTLITLRIISSNPKTIIQPCPNHLLAFITVLPRIEVLQLNPLSYIPAFTSADLNLQVKNNEDFPLRLSFEISEDTPSYLQVQLPAFVDVTALSIQNVNFRICSEYVWPRLSSAFSFCIFSSLKTFLLHKTFVSGTTGNLSISPPNYIDFLSDQNYSLSSMSSSICIANASPFLYNITFELPTKIDISINTDKRLKILPTPFKQNVTFSITSVPGDENKLFNDLSIVLSIINSYDGLPFLEIPFRFFISSTSSFIARKSSTDPIKSICTDKRCVVWTIRESTSEEASINLKYISKVADLSLKVLKERNEENVFRLSGCDLENPEKQVIQIAFSPNTPGFYRGVLEIKDSAQHLSILLFGLFGSWTLKLEPETYFTYNYDNHQHNYTLKPERKEEFILKNVGNLKAYLLFHYTNQLFTSKYIYPSTYLKVFPKSSQGLTVFSCHPLLIVRAKSYLLSCKDNDNFLSSYKSLVHILSNWNIYFSFESSEMHPNQSDFLNFVHNLQTLTISFNAPSSSLPTKNVPFKDLQLTSKNVRTIKIFGPIRISSTYLQFNKNACLQKLRINNISCESVKVNILPPKNPFFVKSAHCVFDLMPNKFVYLTIKYTPSPGKAVSSLKVFANANPCYTVQLSN